MPSDYHRAAEAIVPQPSRRGKCVRRLAGGFIAACLLALPLMAAVASPSSAHSATKQVTGQRQVCTTEWVQVRVATERSTAGRGNRVTYTYKNELREVCKWVPHTYRVNRAHVHISKNTCRVVVGTPLVAASTTAGGIVGTGSGAPGVGTVVGSAIGASAGVAATYTVCELVPDIIWFG